MAFGTTYFIGKKTNSLMRSSTVKVLERASIGLQLNINVVLINGRVYILAIQNKTTQVLDIVDEREWYERKTNINKGDDQK